MIANNPDRLEEDHESASHQEFAYGDVLCLEFPSPDEEAVWIAEKTRSLVGLPFVDRPDSARRGLSYSDVAVLLRSVKGSGDPIVCALRDAGIPVVVVGMTGLFETVEVEAAVVTFEFMAERVSRARCGRRGSTPTWA